MFAISLVLDEVPDLRPEIEQAISEIDGRIKSDYPNVKRVFVEAEARRRPTPRP